MAETEGYIFVKATHVCRDSKALYVLTEWMAQLVVVMKRLVISWFGMACTFAMDHNLRGITTNGPFNLNSHLQCVWYDLHYICMKCFKLQQYTYMYGLDGLDIYIWS